MERRRFLSICNCVSKHSNIVVFITALKNYILILKFRIGDYSVVSTLNSVIYLGGYTDQTMNGPINDDKVLDIVAEFKDLEWNQLGILATARFSHRSVNLNNKIYIIGSGNK